MDRWQFDLEQPLPGEDPDNVSPETGAREMEAFRAFTAMV